MQRRSICFSALLSAFVLVMTAAPSRAQGSAQAGPFDPRSGRFATAAQVTSPRPPDTLTVPVATAWAALADVYSTLNIPLSVVDTESHVLGALRVPTRRNVGGERLSRTVQCGTGPFGANADRYTVSLVVLSHVSSLPDGRSLLDTRVGGTAAPNGLNSSVTCGTSGTLEDKIVAELRKRI